MDDILRAQEIMRELRARYETLKRRGRVNEVTLEVARQNYLQACKDVLYLTR